MSALAKFATTRSNAVSLTAFTIVSPMRFGLHLRRQVVGGHLQRRNQRAVFAGERRLDAAVEEVRHVRKLLRLRHAQVAQLVRRQNVGQNVVHRLRQNHQRQLVELVVLRHAQVVQVLRNLACAESSRPALPSLRDRARPCLFNPLSRASTRVICRARSARKLKLMHTSSSRICPTGLPARIDHDKRNQELVGDAVVVALLDARHGIGDTRRPRPCRSPSRRMPCARAPSACRGPWRSSGR